MKINEKFQELEDKGEGAYMPHIYYGDPTEKFSISQVEALAGSGADLLEFGIPFSDPTADGAVFQAACERALEGGVTPEKCLGGINKVRERGLKIPIIVTTYHNIPYVFGFEEFFEKMKKVGAQGIIIPDLPIEEASTIEKKCQEKNIKIIFQITPNTSEKRLKKIIETSSGFLYMVNTEGVTGVKNPISQATSKMLKKVKKRTNLPLMSGFGVSKKKHAQILVSAGADGVITGSALAKIYEKNLEKPEEKLSKIRSFAKNIKQGCRNGYD